MSSRTVLSDFQSFASQHLQGVEFSFNDTLAVLLRRWKVIAVSTLALVALGASYLVLAKPQYTAEGMLQINTRQERVMNVDEVLSGLNGNDAAIRTEIDVLQSRKLAHRVIEKLNLANNADFSSGTSLLAVAKNMVKALILPATEESSTAKSTDETRNTTLANAFLGRLDVRMLPRSYSIQARFTAANPVLARDIANAVMQEYLTSQLEDRLDAARRATSWMNDRSKQLQKRVQASEMAVQSFRQANNLTTAKGIKLSDQQLSELSSQLILARAQLAEAQARSSNSASVGRFDTTADVLNSPLIQNLRIQETEVRRKMSDLAARYGDRHPRMMTVRNELSNIQGKIGEESAKIRGSLQNEVSVAQARVQTFESQLKDLQTQSNTSNDAEVQLMELERQAEAERTLYESFLNRSKEVAQMDFAQSDARIIYAAETPQSPSAPNKGVVMAAATLLGLLLGIGLVMLLEMLDSGYRTVQQLEAATKLPVLGMLGELPHENGRPHYVLEKPTSAFAEGIRAVRTALGFAKPDQHLQVIMVTSSVPQEGKSLLSAALAHVAAMGGGKTLLIDADMRRPTQAHNFGLKPAAGLAEVLVGKAKVKDVVYNLNKTSLYIIPSLANSQFAQELLGSEKMKSLIAELRKEFETIIIDCPPVMAVADALTVSGLADASLFAVRWGTTPRPLAVNGIKKLQSTGLGVTGVVMTRVDLERQKAYGLGDYGYYYGKYKDYYND
ncbi:MAG: polysaccharide biosynthesis tyrosine autokinase [Alphaproteobacteria bacterium]